MTVRTLEKQFKNLPHSVDSLEVRWLYTHLPPLPIANDRDHAVYKRAVGFLMGEEKTSGEYRFYLDAVIHFLDEYERGRFPADATPEDVLCFLMGEHHLTQKDLSDELGGQSVVSSVLNGKRKLTRNHIEKLSRRFSISPVSFFPVAKVSLAKAA
jgi:HTH-type transcriptional regulator/antitoxin HigA